jgi:hypothetical protein
LINRKGKDGITEENIEPMSHWREAYFPGVRGDSKMHNGEPGWDFFINKVSEVYCYD